MAPTSTYATANLLWLVRHGESTWNTLGLAQGHDDQAELTSRGQRQAAEVAARFADRPVRAVYVSDLRRARQTAAPIAAVAGVRVIPDVRLRERSLGVLEGTPVAGNGPAATGLDLGAGQITDPDLRPAGGESVRDLYQRAAAFCDEVLAAPEAGPDVGPDAKGGVIAVAHGGTLRVLRAYLSGIPVEHMDWGPLPNATVLEFSRPGFPRSTRPALPTSPALPTRKETK